MNRRDSEFLEIYVGMPVAHLSEQKLLDALAHFAEATSTPLIALANFEFGGRQFDFVVIAQNRVTVVDAKFSAFPVRGKINGIWEHLLPGRNWLPLTNGYQQVLDRKNLLRNSMSGAASGFYPEAAVVFTDAPPQGSDLTKGDFKVEVYHDLRPFIASLKNDRSNPWSFEDWRKWAQTQNLSRMSLPEAINHEPASFLRRYREAFAAEYGPQAGSWIPENEEQRALIGQELAQSPGIYIRGPSGCGKTLMMKAAAVALAETGIPVIFLQGKDISSTLPDALRTEIGLIGDVSYDDFRRAIKATSEPLCIFLDGINEMPATALARTLRGVATLARRLGARVVVSGQQSCPEQLPALKTLNVSRPGNELKQKIATAASGPLSPAATQLLTLVQSGFEAAITGELQHDLGPTLIRSHLIEQYIRKRLPRNSRALAAALGALASQMFGHLAFSMTEPSFDDLMLARGLTDEDFETLFASGLIERRGGRVSFSHEMVFYGSASRAYSREARTNAMAVAAVLNTAFGEPLALDVIAGADDDTIVLAILENIQNPQLLAQVAASEAGQVAAAAAEKLLRSALILIADEVAVLALQITDTGISWASEPEYTLPEKARLGALGLMFNQGLFVDEYMNLCRDMDARLKAERVRLLAEPDKPKISVKSQAFALAYLGHYGGRNVGFTMMVRASQPMFERKARSNWLQHRPLLELTSGELYAVTERAWLFCEGDENYFCRQIADVIETRLAVEPYHVQLSLMHNAGFVRDASDAAIRRLVEAIQSLDTDKLGLAISTSVVDALKHLGALDDEAEEARASIRDQVVSAVLAPEDEDARDTALWIYGCQFDHPYDHIFYEEIAALPPEQKQILLLRAFRADRLRQSFSLVFIMREIAEQDNPAHAPLFKRFAICPQINPMWQDEIGSFVLAIRFLVRHRSGLPDAPSGNDSERCFSFLRDIVAAVESRTPEAMVHAASAWRNLLTLPAALVMTNLRDIAQEGLSRGGYYRVSTVFPLVELGDLFPGDLLAIARRFVQGREPAKCDRGFNQQQATDYACQIVGKLGDRGDLGALRSVISISEFSRSAIAAIAEIERRA